ncbi:ABC transporter ATP-binding protein [Varunaivibrio sulfuroxidans]|uniref:Iron(III) transport system ATP-binding protein n=1 Tax=Varunaivibrio sulfuroxidans TaxID=1773489 RepID=A0A4R3JAV3_9PROT|nr:ABC transporter ATP-binding protein [Varunaivibrio sulfuroxidans]TCS63008.1 iron(III) transport system ATP-binding protein [Varunaivibrio sulfuroxidans]WES31915.1 ABC transporter ATP-binding protein [Varunaivibrio sulfuroxidans]
MTPNPPFGGLSMDRIAHGFARHPVLKDVSLTVEGGKVACLLGPSGCGKTTLLRLAAGLEPIQHGCIAIGGRIVADGDRGHEMPPEKRGVGLMFQDYALFPHLNIFENIAFGLSSRGREKRREWIAEALTRTGLAAHANSYPHMLSGGQQQRVALLRALAPNPRVLLLDEPFSGLDVTRRVQIREETRNLLKATGVATLMVTHDPEEAMFMGDHIVVMNDGRIIQDGTPAQIYLQPNAPFVAALFGPMNAFTAAVRNGVVATPLGDVAAGTLENGSPAQVLIRPEGISVFDHKSPPGHAATGAARARVLSARLLGRSAHLHLTLENIEGDAPIVQARVDSVFAPEENTLVTLRADPRQAFVFPLLS